MDDIARLSGFSKPTVSRALSDHPAVLPETRERILEVANAHGYVVNRNAQRLRVSRTNTVAVVIDFPSLPDRRISQPFHYELLADVANALAARGQDVLLSSPAPESAYRAMFTSKGIDGIIFLGQGDSEPALRALARGATTPFVVWGAPTDGGYCTIGSDNELGGRLAARRFLDLRRSQVAFLGPPGHAELDARRRGLELGLAEAAAPAPLTLQARDLSYEAAFEVMVGHLRAAPSRPDAILCASDTIAMAVISALQGEGLAVPGDVTVIGYDDTAQAAWFIPPLTTVRQDTRLAGALLVERLMQRIERRPAPSATLPTEIIVRST